MVRRGNSKRVEPFGEMNSTFFDSPIYFGSFVDINIFCLLSIIDK